MLHIVLPVIAEWLIGFGLLAILTIALIKLYDELRPPW